MSRRVLSLRKESLAELAPSELGRAAGRGSGVSVLSVECIAVSEGTVCDPTATIVNWSRFCPYPVSLDPDVC